MPKGSGLVFFKKEMPNPCKSIPYQRNDNPFPSSSPIKASAYEKEYEQSSCKMQSNTRGVLVFRKVMRIKIFKGIEFLHSYKIKKIPQMGIYNLLCFASWPKIERNRRLFIIFYFTVSVFKPGYVFVQCFDKTFGVLWRQNNP